MIEVATHVHTVLSGHAFSTVWENAKMAKEKGIKGFASTDHGPSVPGSAPRFLPYTMRTWPTHIEGVRVYKSCEANIIDVSGELDIQNFYLSLLDFVIAGLHFAPEKEFDKKNTTKAYIAAYENDYVDVVVHPDNPRYPCDFEEIVKAAKRMGKPIEINNQSLVLREGAKENVSELVKQCLKHETKIVLASDAHICFNIGEVTEAEKLIKEFNFPKEMILNASFKRFEDYIDKRKKRLNELV